MKGAESTVSGQMELHLGADYYGIEVGGKPDPQPWGNPVNKRPFYCSAGQHATEDGNGS